jgi:hypothetical protein
MYIILLLLSFYFFLGSNNEVCFDITYEYSITYIIFHNSKLNVSETN